MRLLYEPDPPALPHHQPEPPALSPLIPAPSAVKARDGGRLAWSGLVLGTAEDPLPVVTAADLWTTPFPPTHGISPAALEAAVRAAGPVSGDLLTIDRIVPCPGAQHVDRLLPVEGGWVGSRAGEPVLFVAEVIPGSRRTGRSAAGSPRHRSW